MRVHIKFSRSSYEGESGVVNRKSNEIYIYGVHKHLSVRLPNDRPTDPQNIRLLYIFGCIYFVCVRDCVLVCSLTFASVISGVTMATNK